MSQASLFDTASPVSPERADATVPAETPDHARDVATAGSNTAGSETLVSDALVSDPLAPGALTPETEVLNEDQAHTTPVAMEVRVIRSARRKKSVQARVVDGVVELRIPASASAAQEAQWKAEMVERFERSRSSSQSDLPERARELSKRFDLPTPTSVRWVTNQKFRWGSCTVSQGTIRISDQVAAYPNWVLDYVLMHEMCHLVHADHSPAFWELVARYPQAEKAKGYLEAKADGR